jgi:hypothetical protein
MAANKIAKAMKQGDKNNATLTSNIARESRRGWDLKCLRRSPKRSERQT